MLCFTLSITEQQEDANARFSVISCFLPILQVIYIIFLFIYLFFCIRIGFAGNETHGVHVCHKCGWPFPNPHPSAKHRRAHRKVCGTIEGYKLNESQDLNLSDEDNHSDEDPTTPSKLTLSSLN